jgi:hypothetical protein
MRCFCEKSGRDAGLFFAVREDRKITSGMDAGLIFAPREEG